MVILKGDKVRIASIDCAGQVHDQDGVAVGCSSKPDARGRIKVRLREQDDGSGSAASLRLGRPKGVFLRGHGERKASTGGDDRYLYGSLYVA